MAFLWGSICNKRDFIAFDSRCEAVLLALSTYIVQSIGGILKTSKRKSNHGACLWRLFVAGMMLKSVFEKKQSAGNERSERNMS
jgi:hypothetical protein